MHALAEIRAWQSSLELSAGSSRHSNVFLDLANACVGSSTSKNLRTA